MADLRAAVESRGHAHVRTHIQSGNVLFTSSKPASVEIATDIAYAITARNGLTVPVIVRPIADLVVALEQSPFPGGAPANTFVAFLDRTPTAAEAGALETERFLPDRFELIGADLHQLCPNGAGNTKMTLGYFEKRLNCRGTARNLNTIAKLIGLAAT
jgi:uncharacterized protein (DUF1697 family)